MIDGPGGIRVVEYDPAWPRLFEALAARVSTALGDLPHAVEHVGSTSVPGLAAKPIIDMSAVVDTEDDVPRTIERLATIGYRHLGDLGITGREAFQRPEGSPPHHLYVCPRGSLGLRNHLTFRDHLRAHPDDAEAYARVKQRLARAYPDDIDAYVDGKTTFILSVLSVYDLTEGELGAIGAANRLPRADDEEAS